MTDKITIQQPINLDLFASIIKVISEYSREHKKDVQFKPQGKEIIILVESVAKTATERTYVFGDEEPE
jgi:hypothetical protein